MGMNKSTAGATFGGTVLARTFRDLDPSAFDDRNSSNPCAKARHAERPTSRDYLVHYTSFRKRSHTYKSYSQGERKVDGR